MVFHWPPIDVPLTFHGVPLTLHRLPPTFHALRVGGPRDGGAGAGIPGASLHAPSAAPSAGPERGSAAECGGGSGPNGIGGGATGGGGTVVGGGGISGGGTFGGRRGRQRGVQRPPPRSWLVAARARDRLEPRGARARAARAQLPRGRRYGRLPRWWREGGRLWRSSGGHVIARRLSCRASRVCAWSGARDACGAGSRRKPPKLTNRTERTLEGTSSSPAGPISNMVHHLV